MKKMFLFSNLATGLDKVRFFLDDLPRDSKFVAITTAANVYDPNDRSWFDDEINLLKGLGFDFYLFDLAGKTKDDVTTALEGAKVVYVSGGNSYYLLEHMKACSFVDVMENLIKKGTIYLGSSAGAAVTGPDIGYVGDMDDRSRSNLSDDHALGLIEYKVLPHLDHPKYGPMIKNRIDQLKKENRNLIGLRDHQVLFVDDGYVEIY